MRLIAERCLDRAEREKLSAEDSADKVLSLTRLRLDRLRIGSMDGVEMCNGATHLHLQHNLITQIDSLDFFDKLQFLVLAHNQIEVVEGVAHLHSLQYLDLSANRIESVAARDLPPSLQALDLYDNPCSEAPDYRSQLVTSLAKLFQLDDKRVTKQERRAAAAQPAGGADAEDDDDDDDDDDEGEEEETDDEDEEGEEEGEEEEGEPAAVEAAAGGADEADLLRGEDGRLDVSKLYAMAMTAHGADEVQEMISAKVRAVKERRRERSEFEDILKEAAELTGSVDVLEKRRDGPLAEGRYGIAAVGGDRMIGLGGDLRGLD